MPSTRVHRATRGGRGRRGGGERPGYNNDIVVLSFGNLLLATFTNLAELQQKLRPKTNFICANVLCTRGQGPGPCAVCGSVSVRERERLREKEREGAIKVAKGSAEVRFAEAAMEISNEIIAESARALRRGTSHTGGGRDEEGEARQRGHWQMKILKQILVEKSYNFPEH